MIFNLRSLGVKEELFRVVVLPCLFIRSNNFMQLLNLDLGCHWWFTYPSPLLDDELECTCLSG